MEISKINAGKTYTISTDPNKLDLDMLYNYLSDAYWCKGRNMETIQKSILHSLNFGLYEEDRQIGFARVVTDHATFAYLADVFLLETYQGKGLGTWLVKSVIEDAGLDLEKGWILRTKDAHKLYEKFDFRIVSNPEMIMERKGGY